MAYKRSITVAFDKICGEIIEADQVFDTAKNAFEVRKQFHKNEVELYCCECEQKLNVSTSKYDRLHFKHVPGHDFCLLSAGNMTQEEHEAFSGVFLMKESARHKLLKHKIAAGLYKTNGVDIDSVAIDNKFIFDGKDKRRPDVFCKYLNKEIAFEIQISNLSLRYIISRHDFYKKKGIYLIWILDNLDIHSQTQMARDIKYLTTYENFFRLDETSDILTLQCEYKQPFLTNDNVVKSKWNTSKVTLADLQFDQAKVEAFFFNYSLEKEQKEREQSARDAELRAREEQKQAQERQNTARAKARRFIQLIADRHKKQWQDYGFLTDFLEEMTPFEVEILNQELKLDQDETKRPALIRWILNAKSKDFGFIHFLLAAKRIRFDVNKIDSGGSTPLQEIYKNVALWSKPYLVKFLYERGYILKQADADFLSSLGTVEARNDLVLYQIYSRVLDKSLLDRIHRHSSLIFILESAKRKSIVGYNYKSDQWAAFGINSIQYYQSYWNYIERAFKMFDIWNKILEADKKGTFLKKHGELTRWKRDQNQDCDEVIEALYPDLIETHDLVTIV